ncbi:MAG: hypothetical protein MK102_08720 [Fuerstiella sp.]|nr:hypothetical protein [Fuerstiella sp.]
MATPDLTHLDDNITSQLRLAVRQADAGAFLVEPRVTRRLIREMHDFARLSPRIPHTEVCVVPATDVRQLTHPDELGLDSFETLPDMVLLLALPEEHEVAGKSTQDQMILVWRRLFHGAIDRAVRALMDSDKLTRARIQSHIDSVGQVEFDEVHAVLASENRLIHPESRMETFGEFMAVWWEFNRFAPDLIPIWFPSLTRRNPGELISDVQIDPDSLYLATRLTGAPDPDTTSQVVLDEAQLSGVRQDWFEGGPVRPSERRFYRLQRRRQRATERGNTVAGGLAAMYGAESATTNALREDALKSAEEDIGTLVTRLQQALTFDVNDEDVWHESLRELFRNATHGFWNTDKKLLHDLQKVCMDHERVTYQVDLVKWIVSRGQRSLKRPLTNIREVMMAKHLASSAARLVYVRLSGREREQLTNLLHEAADLAEDQMRHRIRPTLRQTLLDVGFRPGNVPEEVAFDKLIEESLDCIAYRGYLTMGYLRDAISRNDLKLADLTDPRELFRGDHLLRTDDQLDVALDGVYRRGEFYLRGLQRVSSLAFGTGVGRFMTLFVVIPFGGALVIVEGAGHVIERISNSSTEKSDGTEVETAQSRSPSPEPDTALTSDQPVIPGTEQTPVVSNNSNNPIEDNDSRTDAIETIGPENSGTSLTEVVEHPTNPTSHDDYPSRPSIYFPLILAIGLGLMALIHLPALRHTLTALLQSLWSVIHLVVWQFPKRILKLPLVRGIWRSGPAIAIRRYILNPGIVACAMGFVASWNIWMIVSVTVILSSAFNSRLGRDTEELVAEWLGNTWHNLRARVFMAVFDWVVDFFKWALSGVERLIYAVDEWLRFHSEESWLSVIVKAVVGVVWSFIVFLIRIYVNLLIEPQVNPIKHFPVVTVAHKIILPLTPFVIEKGGGLLSNFIGTVLADFVIGATWFLFPGVFGFLVWELKGNWRLYEANRVTRLQPILVGSHGEPVSRLIRPGVHSGTIPKAFARLRRLERQSASFRRFSQRRAWQDVLHHAERDLCRFVQRDLLRLLEYCPVWRNTDLRLSSVQISCNSILVTLDSDLIEGRPIRILIQEQSHWIVVSVVERGLLRNVSPAQLHSFGTALLGFYRKAGADIVREQIERNLVGTHPYDVCSTGLIVWPEARFDREVTIDLHRPHQVRPTPAPLAITFGISPASVESVVFCKSSTDWYEWAQLWQINSEYTEPDRLPLACVQSARLSLLRHF